MASGNKYENFFKVWRPIAKNSVKLLKVWRCIAQKFVKLWQTFLQRLRKRKCFIQRPKHRAFTFKNQRVLELQTWLTGINTKISLKFGVLWRRTR